MKPYHILYAKKKLEGSAVMVCPVIGFPHGNSLIEVKKFEAIRAVEEGAEEVDMVVNIGRVLSGKWDYVETEIKRINDAVVGRGSILKVIFENDCELRLPILRVGKCELMIIDLKSEHIIKLCEICSSLKVAYIKTSTGYGFIKQANGDYNYKGATISQLELMRKHASSEVKIKAAGGIRTLDDLLRMRALGISRVGATATVAIMEEAVLRGIGKERVDVDVPPF